MRITNSKNDIFKITVGLHKERLQADALTKLPETLSLIPACKKCSSNTCRLSNGGQRPPYK
jgi:hypothetical protein